MKYQLFNIGTLTEVCALSRACAVRLCYIANIHCTFLSSIPGCVSHIFQLRQVVSDSAIALATRAYRNASGYSHVLLLLASIVVFYHTSSRPCTKGFSALTALTAYL